MRFEPNGKNVENVKGKNPEKCDINNIFFKVSQHGKEQRLLFLTP